MKVPPDPHLDDLLHGLCDEQLTAEAIAELEQRLTQSRAARDRYREFLRLHGLLAWNSVGAAAPAERLVALNHVRTKWKWFTPAIGLAAVAACALLLVWSGSNGPPREAVSSPTRIATVVRTVACSWKDRQWEGDSSGIAAGNRLTLSTGLAEIVFENGAIVILQGPSELTVKSDRHLFLREGSITVTAPPGLDGFTVSSEAAQVIDRGTQFGVQVEPDGGLQVHVLDGRVDAQPTGSPELPRRVNAGQAMRIDVVRSVAEIRSEPERFTAQLRNTQRIVDWGGLYHQPSKRMAGSSPTVEQLLTTAYAAADETPATLLRWPFSEKTPLSPNFDRLPPGLSSRFYGGLEIWSLDGKGIVSRQRRAIIVNGPDSDSVRLFHPNGPSLRVFGLWLFFRSDFLVDRPEPWTFGSASGLAAEITANHGSHYAVRFVVKSGGKYYLSRTATNEARRFTLSGWELVHERWAEYHPERDLRAAGGVSGTADVVSNLSDAAGSLEFDTTTAALGDIEAVGLYAESIDTKRWPNRHLEWNRFQVDGEVKR